eukprot:TRINITY_DN3513_c0_g1_i1.p1 TRINITY_DN3513_c0_g1~~TRINITY_DN3513_c0_g1_i1.p1  ORF type:complete len:255 (+),score=57.06 TRINITY_DN3513_c0_g1_i1:590-1354(+)
MKNVDFKVYVDIDPNEHRTGLDPEDSEGIEIVKRIISSQHLEFYGLYVHGGHSYESHNPQEIKKCSIEESEMVLSFKTYLENQNISVGTVAIGSTPTASHPATELMQQITEFHPGNYIFYDTHQANIGSCSFKECSNVIITRVISRYKGSHKRLLIDAGALALSKDLGASHTGYKQYGVIVGHPELKISSISQEVGIVVAADGEELVIDQYPIGTMLKIIPNHSCMSNYCFDHVYVADDEDNVIDEWVTCPRHY